MQNLCIEQARTTFQWKHSIKCAIMKQIPLSSSKQNLGRSLAGTLPFHGNQLPTLCTRMLNWSHSYFLFLLSKRWVSSMKRVQHSIQSTLDLPLEPEQTWPSATMETFKKRVIVNFPILMPILDTNKTINTQLHCSPDKKMETTFCSSNGRFGKLNFHFDWELCIKIT